MILGDVVVPYFLERDSCVEQHDGESQNHIFDHSPMTTVEFLGTWEIKIKPKNRRSKKNKPRKMVDSPPLVTQESNNEIYDETSRDSVDFLNNTDIICSDPEETIPSSVPEENQLMELTMSKRKDSPPSKSQGPSPKKSSQNSS
eukprot:TRINITY_DN725_c0_g1_i2.p1 TRINITY_DN725_c0_g1~~TRINITY_DN725_c0_g1_i2.p1  ORF type:complete len:144 (+),score=23.32 TRINITY_DN725_c0_g1_i2:636-1067(+)